MFTPRTHRTTVVAMLLGLGLTLAACGPAGGIGQDEVDEIRAQLESVEQRLDAIHGLLTSAHDEVDGNAVDLVDEAQRELDGTRDVLADVLAELEPPPPPPEPDPVAPGAAPDAPAF